MVLESKQAPFKLKQGGEIIRRENLSLNNRKVDLNLVEPTGMDQGMDEEGVRPFGAHPGDLVFIELSGKSWRRPDRHE